MPAPAQHSRCCRGQVRDYVRRRRWVRRRVREGTAAAAAAGPTPLLPLANMLGDAAGAVGDLAQDSARRLKEAAAAAAEGAQARPCHQPVSGPESITLAIKIPLLQWGDAEGSTSINYALSTVRHLSVLMDTMTVLTLTPGYCWQVVLVPHVLVFSTLALLRWFAELSGASLWRRGCCQTPR